MRRRFVSRAVPTLARLRAQQFRGKRLRAWAGSFALTGTDAALRLVTGLVLAGNPGSFALTGQAASLLSARKLAAGAGSFALTGQDATMFRGKRVGAEAGSFALSGQAASLLKSGRLAAAAGSFALTGTAATLTKSGGVPTIVNSATTNFAAGSPSNVNLPASIVAGNKLVILLGVAGNQTVTTPAGWTASSPLATSGGTAGADRRLYVFEKTASGSEGATVAISSTGTTGGGMAIAYQINGSSSATLYANGGAASTVAPDPPNNNPGSSAATLWIAAAVKRESVDASGAPSGYANLVVSRNGSNISGMAADKTSTASSEDPGTFSGFSVSDNYAAVTLGFRT